MLHPAGVRAQATATLQNGATAIAFSDPLALRF
jgi:hypothetical protein